jgi:hypothetical protein
MNIAVRTALTGALLLGVGWGAPLAAIKEADSNAAAVVEYPTALDQPMPQTVHAMVDIYDLGAPDLRALNAGYGYQYGNLQLLADAYWRPEPRGDLDRAEAKIKLRFLSLDEYGVYGAVGGVARYSGNRQQDIERLDDKPYSLLGVITAQFYPFAAMGPFLANFYLDNRFGSLGAKVPLLSVIRIVAEANYHHAAASGDRWQGTAGLEFEGDQNFYVQFVYDTVNQHTRFKLGSSF